MNKARSPSSRTGARYSLAIGAMAHPIGNLLKGKA
jgi:hypothetical protein